MTTSDGTVIGTTKIVDSGPATQRWNLVIMGDGYTAAQMGQFANDAKSFVNTFFATPPYGSLKPAVNVYRVDVSSTDSGADDPTACGGSGATARTYFDASFCNSGIQRLLVVNTTTALTVAGNQVPQWSMAMVIVNSTVYGGSGGSVAVFSLAAGANEIALHEMGHTAFGLADEYEYYAGCGADVGHDHHPAGEPAQPNVTLDAGRATNKWRDLVAPTTAMPTTSNADCTKCDPQANPVPAATVGAFEGAHYYHCGAYRAQFECRMRALGNPYCAVCTRRIRQTIEPYLPAVVSRVSSVARHPGHLDVFWLGTDGKVWSQWWDQAPGQGWGNHGAFPIANSFPVAPAARAGVAAVARVPGHLDVFWPGADGKIWSAWWDQAPGQGWGNHGVFPIANSFPVPPAVGAGIAALGRLPGHLDVFWPGADGKVWSAWWDQAPGQGWGNHGVFPIANAFPVAPAAGAGIAAVARVPGHLDVFWPGADGKVWSAWWDQAPGQGWGNHGVFPIANSFPVPPAVGAGIAALGRLPGHLDVFWPGADGKIWSAWWDQAPGQGWGNHGVFPIANAFPVAPAAGAGIAAVARVPGHLDVFWPGADGKIWSAWWDQAPGQGWGNHGVFPIANSFPVPPATGAGISAVGRLPGHLDVFWPGVDGKIWSAWWDQAPGQGWGNHSVFPIA
ncbi:M64 family metallopeptidase [Kitasatospora sp. NPDC056446]|uniref:M64 family metallopeptidase n=1 Tax=Kitasatospora sp. NPDC056446 TaxID=3345819 RepID=UPI0036B45EFE